MNWFRAAALVALMLLVAGAAMAQGSGNSFPTPNGQPTGGTAILVPCGSIVNGQPVMCPPGTANPVPVICANCSSSAPIGAATNTVNGTIAVTDAFQTIVAQNAARKGCNFQNQGTHIQYYSVASSPTKANSWQVQPGGSFRCADATIVVTDAIKVTGTAADAFAGGWQ